MPSAQARDLYWFENEREQSTSRRNLTAIDPRDLIPEANLRAARLGHLMGEWWADEPDPRPHKVDGGERPSTEWIAQCEDCRLYAGVTYPDPEDEPTGLFGSCLQVECRGLFRTEPHWAKPKGD